MNFDFPQLDQIETVLAVDHGERIARRADTRVADEPAAAVRLQRSANARATNRRMPDSAVFRHVHQRTAKRYREQAELGGADAEFAK